MENVFYAHLKEIVKTAYDGGEEPKYDWQTAIDRYNAEHHITEGMTVGRASQQRSDFLQYVEARKFDKNGDEIRV